MRVVTAAAMAAFLVLGGCESLTSAGITKGTFNGKVCGQPVNLTYESGKEFGGITGRCSTNPETGAHEAEFAVSGVAAFQGQQIAASVAEGIKEGIAGVVGPLLQAGKIAGGVP